MCLLSAFVAFVSSSIARWAIQRRFITSLVGDDLCQSLSDSCFRSHASCGSQENECIWRDTHAAQIHGVRKSARPSAMAVSSLTRKVSSFGLSGSISGLTSFGFTKYGVVGLIKCERISGIASSLRGVSHFCRCWGVLFRICRRRKTKQRGL